MTTDTIQDVLDDVNTTTWSELMVQVLRGELPREDGLTELDARSEGDALLALRLSRARAKGWQDALITQACVWLSELARACAENDMDSYHTTHAALLQVAEERGAALRHVLFELLLDPLDHYAMIRGRRRHLPEDAIEDLFQEASINLLETLGRGGYDESKLRGRSFIAMIVQRRETDAYRRADARARNIPREAAIKNQEGDILDPLERVSDDALSPEEFVTFGELYGELYIEYRRLLKVRAQTAPQAVEVWILVREEGLGNKEAAAKIDIKSGTVGATLFQMRAWLVKQMSQFCLDRGLEQGVLADLVEQLAISATNHSTSG